MKRRNFLKSAATATAALLGADLLPAPSPLWAPAIAAEAATRPNILVILVDQLRTPQWFPAQARLDTFLPNIARLRTGAVNFRSHFTAANACGPARGALLTGLYAHQTCCLLTRDDADMPNLHPGFPTWGTLLGHLGYQTWWFGRWHLSQSCNLEPYGFRGGTCPSPSIGLSQDPGITDQFRSWLQSQDTSSPWCTTVSFVNPHDIAGYYLLTDTLPLSNPPHLFTRLPPNFETPDQLVARKKPRCQLVLQEVIESKCGALPFSGPDFEARWLELLDLYLLLQRLVDIEIGRVLDALEDSGAANTTIVLFTSDHGEYGGSHGLRNKGGGAYEEAIRIPLYVKDPTGQFTRNPEIVRKQFTSSVDITPLLLTIASGGNSWRTRPAVQHLARRPDLSAILRDPAAAGRPYILHTTDERQTFGLTLPPGMDTVPAHVIALRTPAAKLASYSHWTPGSMSIEPAGQESECYDYTSQAGRLEVDNVAATQPTLSGQLYDTLVNTVIPRELRAPLPDYLLSTQEAALAAYLAYIGQT